MMMMKAVEARYKNQIFYKTTSDRGSAFTGRVKLKTSAYLRFFALYSLAIRSLFARIHCIGGYGYYCVTIENKLSQVTNCRLFSAPSQIARFRLYVGVAIFISNREKHFSLYSFFNSCYTTSYCTVPINHLAARLYL